MQHNNAWHKSIAAASTHHHYSRKFVAVPLIALAQGCSVHYQCMRSPIACIRRDREKERGREKESARATAVQYGGGGGFTPSQIRGGKFRRGKFWGAPWVDCITRCQSPQCVLLVCEKFAENPDFHVGNFAVHLTREISHAKLNCHEPPCIYDMSKRTCTTAAKPPNSSAAV